MHNGEVPIYKREQHGNIFHWVLRLVEAERLKLAKPEPKFVNRRPPRRL